MSRHAKRKKNHNHPIRSEDVARSENETGSIGIDENPLVATPEGVPLGQGTKSQRKWIEKTVLTHMLLPSWRHFPTDSLSSSKRMNAMIRRSAFLTVVISMFSLLPLTAQKLSPAEKEILMLQDRRSLGDGRLVSYLQHKDKLLRYRGAIALANLQDTTTVEPLIPLLRDPEHRVRAAAAFALGQIGTLSAEDALTQALTPEQDITVLGRILEALGKCGREQSLNTVVSYIPSAKNIAVKRDQALAIARFALRKVTSERSVWFCFDLLNDNNSETRWSALYALWRSAPMGVIDLEISKRTYLLGRLVNDKSADVRINLATLLGKTKSKDAATLLTMLLEAEEKAPDWRVQVQVARSLAGSVSSNPELLEKLLILLQNSNDHVKIASLMAVETIAQNVIDNTPIKDKLVAAVEQLASTSSKDAVMVQGEAIVALGKLNPEGLAKFKNMFDDSKVSNTLKAKYIEGLSFDVTVEHVKEVIDRLNNDSIRVSMAAWDFIKRMIQPAVLTARGIDTAFIRTLPSALVDQMSVTLARKDMALTTLVANTMGDTTVYRYCQKAGLGDRIVNEFIIAYGQLTSPGDVEAMQAMISAFGKFGDSRAVPILEKALSDPDRSVALDAVRGLLQITGKNYADLVPRSDTPAYSDYDWNTFESIAPSQRVVVKTNKGTFSLRLRKEDAPFTVLAFVKLARKKFYNGLTFHRVVPNFVIQGGDPRGDGWGGPGYAIRSEWSVVNFERGAVGVASSGKDTEGCQFFVTHLPIPHLDGRYTVFATVSSGMEVIDKIQVGDRILNLELR